MIHTLTNLVGSSVGHNTLILTGFSSAFGASGIGSVQAQGNSQVLSPSELQRINNQPLALTVNTSDITNAPQGQRPSFQHKEATGTEIIEYKDVDASTQVDIKAHYISYERVPPTSVIPRLATKEIDLISIPCISIPF